MKLLIGAACVAVIAMCGLQFWKEFLGPAPKHELVATPRIIERCEREVANLVTRDDKKPMSEGEKRAAAIGVVYCRSYGLLDPRLETTISKSQYAAHVDALAANPDVWRASN